VAFDLDLVALAPGKDDEEALAALLRRPESLGIRRIAHRTLRHHRRDPGCYHEAAEMLQPFQDEAARALVMFDHEGSGQEGHTAADVAEDVRRRLETSGWDRRAEVLVVEPELEAWVWSDSPHVDEGLGWRSKTPSLRTWLVERGLWEPGHVKPAHPKDAVVAALRAAGIPRSSAIYGELASRVSLTRCQDPSFSALLSILRRWFPRE
jgi:hypothetical protein